MARFIVAFGTLFLAFTLSGCSEESNEGQRVPTSSTSNPPITQLPPLALDAANVEYLQEVTHYVEQIQENITYLDSMDLFISLDEMIENQTVYSYSDDWLISVGDGFDQIYILTELLEDLSPPANLKDVHHFLAQSSKHYRQFLLDYVDGLDQKNLYHLEQARYHMWQGNHYLDSATRRLKQK